MEQILRLQEVLEEVERDHRHQLQWVSASQQESEDHLKRMQSEILSEVDRLRNDVGEGRARIQKEIARAKSLREDNLKQMRQEFAEIREAIDATV